MKNRPLWFNIFSIVALAIAIVNIFMHEPVLRIVTMLCLATLMASLGVFEWKKNRKMAFMFFGVAAFQVYVFADMTYVAIIR